MSTTAKYYATWVISVAAIVLSLLGLNNIAGTRSADGIAGVGLLFGGVLIGLPVTLTRYYLRQKRTQALDQQQVATETLARMAAADANGFRFTKREK